MTTRIAILVEGATEAVLKPPLLHYLQQRLAGNMPKLDFAPQDGRLAKGDKLKRQVELLLKTNDAVITLTDVYTGTQPPDFAGADDAKSKMRSWVGPEPHFYPHAAQYEFEAWQLPYWPTIQRLAQSGRSVPSANPESVNHQKPPSRHLAEAYRTGTKKRAYSKIRDATAILRGQDLGIACNACPELKAFVSTILSLCGASPL